MLILVQSISPQLRENLRSFLLASLPYLILCAFALQFTALSMDEYTYLEMSSFFSQGKVLQAPDSSRFPVFPWLLTAWSLPFGHSILSARLLNILIGLACLALVFAVASRLFSKRAAFYSVLFLGSSPFFAFLSSKVLSEPLFFLLLTACVYLVFKSVERKAALIPLGALFSLLVLSRFFGLYLAPVALVFWHSKKRLDLLRTREFLYGAAASVAVFLPWLALSYYATGDALGFFKEFFLSNVQLFQGGFALPDRIASYALFAPFIAGAAIIPIALVLRLLLAKVKSSCNHAAGTLGDDFIYLLVLSSVIITLSLEAYGFLHFRLLRYLVPIAPFVALLAGWASDHVLEGRPSGVWPRRLNISKKMLARALIALVALNMLVGAFVIGKFGTSPKQAGYDIVGKYAAQNCASYYSNVERVIYYYASKPQVDISQADCAIQSTFDPNVVNANYTSGRTLVFEQSGMRVYRKN
ncbi:glycosyltransferase family 39 protein [Candidatus Micrarchaeota archaeon]|nr:glycosyltransferase family 39 protein [Candidatus Micrarchaeota archaeon]